jgi:hypothetical protein
VCREDGSAAPAVRRLVSYTLRSEYESGATLYVAQRAY